MIHIFLWWAWNEIMRDSISFFCKEPGGKYLQSCRPYGLCHSYSNMLLWQWSSHWQYANECAWVCYIIFMFHEILLFFQFFQWAILSSLIRQKQVGTKFNPNVIVYWSLKWCMQIGNSRKGVEEFVFTWLRNSSLSGKVYSSKGDSWPSLILRLSLATVILVVWEEGDIIISLWPLWKLCLYKTCSPKGILALDQQDQ